MSNSCVITNTDTEEKRAYNDDLARPKFAIMDPELTMTLPDYQTAGRLCRHHDAHDGALFCQQRRRHGTDRRAWPKRLLRTVMHNSRSAARPTRATTMPAPR